MPLRDLGVPRLEALRQTLIKQTVTESSETKTPEWVSLYYVKISDTLHTCNVCNDLVTVTEKSPELLEHIQEKHKDIVDVHKEQSHNVNYHIQYLEINDGEEVNKTQTVILEALCKEPTAEQDGQKQVMLKSKKTRAIRYPAAEHSDNSITVEVEGDGQITRKRSWVWKYFHRLSNIIFRCNLCNVVLSIKGCNTNNMNRHVRSRHPTVYAMELQNKHVDTELNTSTSSGLSWTEVETPVAVKTEEISTDKDGEEMTNRGRRSWIWMYFNRTTATSAQCRLCKRHISHGGNATGNMNRHLKMIHNMTATDYSWIWKVFDADDPHHYTCKICQHQAPKLADNEKSVQRILDHLRVEHAVVSGDQIIESHEVEEVLSK